VSRKIRRLPENGRAVRGPRAAADSADRSKWPLRSRKAYKRFGVVHGVIHGAATRAAAASPTRDIPTAPPPRAFPVQRAKGCLCFGELFRGRDLDFVLLLSSLSGVLGGLGYSSYSAANIFSRRVRSASEPIWRVPWISVNWDAWQFPGRRSSSARALRKGRFPPSRGGR